MEASRATLGECPVRGRAPRHLEGRLRVDSCASLLPTAAIRPGRRGRRGAVRSAVTEQIQRGSRRRSALGPTCRSAAVPDRPWPTATSLEAAVRSLCPGSPSTRS